MSQPPWLLALDGVYTPLAGAWNVCGLGRETLSDKEVSEAPGAERTVLDFVSSEFPCKDVWGHEGCVAEPSPKTI